MVVLSSNVIVFNLISNNVRLTGLEPARRETLDPKSSASTNSATGAKFALFSSFRLSCLDCGCKDTQLF